MIQAVILAAGRGSRLGSITEAITKPLLPIGPSSLNAAESTCFLRRHIELLHMLGVHDIVVVAGFNHEMTSQAIARWNTHVRTAVNTEVNRGNLFSFNVAVTAFPEILDGSSYTLLMDADIVYPRQVLEQFLNSLAGSSVLVSEKVTRDGEEVLVYGTPEKLVFIGKNPSEPCKEQVPCLGEGTGIILYAPEDHKLVKKHMNILLDTEAAKCKQSS